MHKSLWSPKSEFDSHTYNMTFWIIRNILLACSSALILAPSPFALGLTILTIAVSVATFYAIVIASWFAFLVFLIYVGGILIIFAYFLAITPNQPYLSPSSLILPIVLTLLCLPTSFITSSSWIPLTNSSRPQIEVIYQTLNIPLLIIVTLILLITIIIVVKVTTNTKGPLRAFISYV